MNGFDLPPPAPVDIDLDELESPGSEWQRLDRAKVVYQSSKTGNLLLVDPDGLNPPSRWGLLP